MHALPKTVFGGGLPAIKAVTAAGFISLSDGIQLLSDSAKPLKTKQGRCLMVKGKTATKKISSEDIRKMMEKKDDNSFSLLFTVGDKKVRGWLGEEDALI